MIPQDNYASFSIRFASIYVENILMSKWEEIEPDNFVTFLNNAANNLFIGTFRGQFWERFVHAYLIKGGTFKVRNLQTKQEFNVQLNTIICKYLHNIEEVSSFAPNADVWLSPVIPNFESVDAIIPGFGLFQITIAKKHPIKHQGLLNVLSRLPYHSDNFRLFFVLPVDQYAGFTSEQPYLTADNHVHKNVSVAVKKVTQFALCFETSPVTQKLN